MGSPETCYVLITGFFCCVNQPVGCVDTANVHLLFFLLSPLLVLLLGSGGRGRGRCLFTDHMAPLIGTQILLHTQHSVGQSIDFLVRFKPILPPDQIEEHSPPLYNAQVAMRDHSLPSVPYEIVVLEA